MQPFDEEENGGGPLAPIQVARETMLAVRIRTSNPEPFCALLGIALAEGMACIELRPGGFPRSAMRGQLVKLAAEPDVLGFSYVTVSDTFEVQDGRNDVVMPGSIGRVGHIDKPAGFQVPDGAEKRSREVVVAAITREGRMVAIFPTTPEGDGLAIAAQPRMITETFLTELFDGLWEQCH